jgi:hypothetical protein
VLASVVNVQTTDRYDVYVGRGKCPVTGKPGEWGNPFAITGYGRAGCMRRYLAFLEERPALVERVRAELAGKVLGCWCKPKQCHGDVLADLANGKTLDAIRADPEWAWIWTEQRELF